MKTIVAAILLLIVAGIQHALAFLGDDMPTIEREYGPVVLQGKTSIFHSQQYRISVTFKAGKTDMEAFSNFNKTPLTNEQIQALLQAQSGGKIWHERAPDKDGSRIWLRPGAIASYSTDDGIPSLMVLSRPDASATVPAPSPIPTLSTPIASPSASPPHLFRPPLLTTPSSVPSARSPIVPAPTIDRREADTQSGFAEGRRIGNRRFREGFPRPTVDYLDKILSITSEDQSAAWKLGFKGGYLSAWDNGGRDL